METNERIIRNLLIEEDGPMPNKNTLVEELKRIFNIQLGNSILEKIEILVQVFDCEEKIDHYFFQNAINVVLTKEGFLNHKYAREFVVWIDTHDIHVYEPSGSVVEPDYYIQVPYHKLSWVKVEYVISKNTL